MPAVEKAGRDDDEREREADPHAVDAPLEDEAEDQAKRQAENPIADEVGDHGRARLAEAAQGSGADRLDSIEDLEGGGDPEQAGAYRKHARVVGEEFDERLRRDKKDDACEKHEARSE